MLFVWYDPLNSNLEETQVENFKCLSIKDGVASRESLVVLLTADIATV